MLEASTCYLPNRTALFCSGVESLGRARVMQRHGADVVASDMTELGARR